MTKAEIEKKKSLARSLFLSGMEQTEIAEKVDVSRVTISKWCTSEGWKEARAAKNVTRPELVNQLDITLGMDFKQNKKNYSLSLLGSPLAYTFMYISNDKITDPGAFNVDPGHKTANLFGSKFTGNLTWTIIPSIVWESKLEYFTTYDTVIASWENTFNFVLNRYLSTKLFVHARYDDGVTLTEDNKSYFQLQELLSFGLNYTW